jgi:hypothetical protein
MLNECRAMPSDAKLFFYLNFVPGLASDLSYADLSNYLTQIQAMP